MGNRRRNLIVLGLVLALLAGSAWVIANKRTVLGLDLRGGTELVYEGRPTAAVPEVTGEDVDRAIEIIRERVDSLGVSEPEISRVGDNQIEIGLPDVSDAERATERIGTTAQLYFYDWEANVIPPNPDIQNPEERPYNRLIDAVEAASKRKPLTEEECKRQRCTASFATSDDATGQGGNDSGAAADGETARGKPGYTYYLFDANTLEPLADPSQDKADLFAEFDGKKPPNSRVIGVPPGTIVVSETPEDDPATEDIDESASGEQYFVLNDAPALTGDEIENPEPGSDPTTNQPIVTFDFTDEGQEKFQEVTREIAIRGAENFFEASQGQDPNSIDEATAANFSDSFAIVLDEEVQSRPIINFKENPNGIDGRTGAQIAGNFTTQQVNDLAEVLRIGALPIELSLISQSTVSATLGEQALDEGLRAGIAGLIIVLIFLMVYYRFLGVVAGLGLLVYAVFFLALIKLIPITLTLPGIAGLILTIGVAADSNIVIFERIKEEVHKGRSMLSAIAEGYKKGIATIIDANVITLITAFILFVLATAGVKGFAFTLGIGTIVSLFTAVLFTQAVLGVLGRSKILRSPSFLGAGGEGKQWNIDFTGLSKWFFSISGVILAIGAIAFADKQFNLGIDFESGTRIQVALSEPATVEEIRDVLIDNGVDGAESAKIQETDNPDFGENVYQIQAQIPPDQTAAIEPMFEEAFGLEGSGEGFQSQSIGPTFGEQVAEKAVWALLFSLLVISAYVAIRFEAKYAVPVLIALSHDILITAGVYALVGREVTSATVAAFLTILGYSMYDCIIVFDRIRENVPRMPRAAFSQIVNRSMSEILTRSLITGLSTAFLVGMLLFFGGETLRDFAFAMMIGLISGTYSSIFIAGPVLTAWKEREPAYRSRRARIVEAMGYVPVFPEQNQVAKIDEVERHVPTPAADGGGGAPAPVGSRAARQTAAEEAPVAITDPPVERAAAPEPTPEEADEGVGARGDGERAKPRKARQKKQSRRRRKHGRKR